MNSLRPLEVGAGIGGFFTCMEGLTEIFKHTESRLSLHQLKVHSILRNLPFSETGTEKKQTCILLSIWPLSYPFVLFRKEVSADGKIVKVFYYNGDLKERRLSVFRNFQRKRCS